MAQANVLNRMNERDEASSAYMNASKCFKKISPQGTLVVEDLLPLGDTRKSMR